MEAVCLVDAKCWCNVLGVVELLFAYMYLQRSLRKHFLTIKIIKHDRCTHLSEDRLDQLVRMTVDGLPS